jgi:X-X-X-Leu-X-X-Gly heptad repeat protein
LTFSGAETDSVSALNGGAPSLADGLYQLTILGTDVTDANGLSLNGGGNYVSPTDTLGGTGLHLFRLFGDADGDGIVDQTDLNAFRGANNSSIGSDEYLYYFDSNNDGSIDQFDLAQFRARNNSDVFG